MPQAALCCCFARQKRRSSTPQPAPQNHAVACAGRGKGAAPDRAAAGGVRYVFKFFKAFPVQFFQGGSTVIALHASHSSAHVPQTPTTPFLNRTATKSFSGYNAAQHTAESGASSRMEAWGGLQFPSVDTSSTLAATRFVLALLSVCSFATSFGLAIRPASTWRSYSPPSPPQPSNPAF